MEDDIKKEEEYLASLYTKEGKEALQKILFKPIIMKTKITIHIESNSEESRDFAEMLCRMYLRWAERKSFQVNMNQKFEKKYRDAIETPSDALCDWILEFESNINLSKEAGVHRLCRLSPFDAEERRWTSFARVSVEIDGKSADSFKLEKSITVYDGNEPRILTYDGPIRNYTLHPYTSAKDNRNGIETENVTNVLDGGEELDKLMGI